MLQSARGDRRRRVRGRGGRDKGDVRAEKPARAEYPRRRGAGEKRAESSERVVNGEHQMAARSANGNARRGREKPAVDESAKSAAVAVTPWPGREERKPRAAAPTSAAPRERGRQMRQSGEEAVVGLGDLVPAFLMNPVRRAK